MKNLYSFAALLAIAAAFTLPAHGQTAQESAERLAPLVVKAMPVGDLFQSYIDRDANWPLGEKVSRVSSDQLQCLRHRLSSAGYREHRRDEVLVFARRYPDKVSESIRVLDSGAADMFGASIQMGAEQGRTGKKGDFNELAKRFSPAQLAAFVELVGDDKHRALRELIGIDDALALDRPGEENQARGRNKGMMIGMKLMLAAMEHCKVPVAALQ